MAEYYIEHFSLWRKAFIKAFTKKAGKLLLLITIVLMIICVLRAFNSNNDVIVPITKTEAYSEDSSQQKTNMNYNINEKAFSFIIKYE